MIGNDIVDLRLAKNQSLWQRKGFLDKTFTKSEQILILSSLEPDLMVWRLWSMKESVYKASRYIDQQMLLNPSQFECRLLSPMVGEVIFSEKVYPTITLVKDGYVLSETKETACENDLLSSVISSGPKELLGEKLYQQLLSDLATRKGWELSDMVLKKNEIGIPQVFYKTKNMPILISLSHHGRFGAYLARL